MRSKEIEVSVGIEASSTDEAAQRFVQAYLEDDASIINRARTVVSLAADAEQGLEREVVRAIGPWPVLPAAEFTVRARMHVSASVDDDECTSMLGNLLKSGDAMHSNPVLHWAHLDVTDSHGHETGFMIEDQKVHAMGTAMRF